MKLLSFPSTKKKKEQSQVKLPVLGDICFNWSDVEMVECSRNNKTIIHFRSGKVFRSGRPFIEGREAFLKSRKN